VTVPPGTFTFPSAVEVTLFVIISVFGCELHSVVLAQWITSIALKIRKSFNPICTGGAHNERTPINIYPSFLNKWYHLPVLSWLLILFLCRHDCENFFLKIQSYPHVCRKCGLDSIFWLNHFPGHK
jgi:hypothetical protein